MKAIQDVPVLGIIGGMGPYAALDLQRKILDAAHAGSDQQHVPMLVWNNGVIPDRQLALKGQGESPLPAILHGVKTLQEAGVSKIAIACNTAHHWYEPMQAATSVEILHIVRETIKVLQEKVPAPAKIGLIATQGALDANLYQPSLREQGYQVLLNSPEIMQQYFMKGCYLVKQGQIAAGAQLMQRCADELAEQGAEYFVLACTEIPLALAAIDSPVLSKAIDPTEILAQACVSWYQQTA